MSETAQPVLDVRITRRVHPGLTIDVSLLLGPEIGVVFGASGAGKTTILRLIAGLARPDSGRVRLGGDVLFDSAKGIDRPLRRRRLGMIFQDDCLFPHLNVAANIRFGLKGWSRDEAGRRLDEVASLCGVDKMLDRDPATLSGGERQRVGLARALAPRPWLLLCDEPVSALDLSNRNAMIERLRKVQCVQQIPILYVTHSPSEAVSLGSRLFLLEHGQILAEGPPLEILSAPRPSPGTPIVWDSLRNVFSGRLLDHSPDRSASRVAIDNGPTLIVPAVSHPHDTRLLLEIRADDIILARQPIAGLSARNQVPGVIERIIQHGLEAEAVIRTGGSTWIVSLVPPAVEQLELDAGCPVEMIIKSRSCHVSVDEPPEDDVKDVATSGIVK
jgi:molybdate transport system ATP-binding protein